MEPTKQDAEAMLKDAGEIESAVRARAPQEYPLYVGMGLTFLLVGLIVDLNAAGGVASVVGAILALVALAVTVGTNLVYLRRYRQVRMRRTPMWVEWALGLWAAAALFGFGILLDGALAVSFTLGGIVGAVPFLLWAERLRRTA
jgi:membrane associated rhomboid family serine protease